MEASTGGLALPNPDEHIPYKIVSQQRREELTPDNRFVDMWEVSYEGPSGTIAAVKVPASQYTPANVDRLIQDDLHNVEGVHALGPSPHPDNLAP